MKGRAINMTALMMVLLFSCAEKAPDLTSDELASIAQNATLTPLEIVNKRMKFYNEHNFESFIKLYHKNVKIYTYPDQLLGTGADRLASIFRADFEKKSIHVEIISQITNGPYVINHEIVTNAGKATKYVSIYEVNNGQITSVRFVRDS